eukprot:scaffold1284_cov353-Prasinococcus_capsulatus_cf.AAC.8
MLTTLFPEPSLTYSAFPGVTEFDSLLITLSNSESGTSVTAIAAPTQVRPGENQVSFFTTDLTPGSWFVETIRGKLDNLLIHSYCEAKQVIAKRPELKKEIRVTLYGLDTRDGRHILVPARSRLFIRGPPQWLAIAVDPCLSEACESVDVRVQLNLEEGSLELEDPQTCSVFFIEPARTLETAMSELSFSPEQECKGYVSQVSLQDLGRGTPNVCMRKCLLLGLAVLQVQCYGHVHTQRVARKGCTDRALYPVASVLAVLTCPGGCRQGTIAFTHNRLACTAVVVLKFAVSNKSTQKLGICSHVVGGVLSWFDSALNLDESCSFQHTVSSVSGIDLACRAEAVLDRLLLQATLRSKLVYPVRYVGGNGRLPFTDLTAVVSGSRPAPVPDGI